MEISPICFLCIVIIFLTEIIVLTYDSYRNKKYKNELEITKFEIHIGDNFHKIIEAKTADEAINIAWKLWKKEQKTLDK